jgi:dihydrofolate synthase / folylpolyglutamate synthase
VERSGTSHNRQTHLEVTPSHQSPPPLKPPKPLKEYPLMKLGSDPFERVVASVCSQSLDHIELGLDRMREALSVLGNPHLSLPPVIHVAGTNGKGSTCAFIAHLLKAHELRVHRYTSPHLVSFQERIILAGSNDRGEDAFITLALFEKTVEVIRQKASHIPLTPFEVITLSAFILFSEFKADVLILETGLGGRLDATNVIPHPALSVITSISLDHLDFLGKTLIDIATQKAGIIKKECPVIIAPQQDAPVDSLLEETAISLHAPFYKAIPVQQGVWTENMLWTSPKGEHFTLPPLPLYGDHQKDNAGSALLATWLFLKGILDPKAVYSGIQSTFWPARLQYINPHHVTFPFSEKNFDLWLDGGHNPDGAKRLCESLNALNHKEKLPLHLCFTLMKNRDPLAFLEPFLKTFSSEKGRLCLWLMKTPPSSSLWDGHALAQLCDQHQISYEITESLEHFIKTFIINCSSDSDKQDQPSKKRVLIAGSLYLAGAFLKDYHCPLSPWGWQEKIS